jgi:hypothetical protein
MLKVTLSPQAQSTLNDLADEDREDVQRWCKELRGWKPDKFFSRTAGIETKPGDMLYLLKTDREIRLMFRATAKRVAIEDIVPTDAVRRRMAPKTSTPGKIKMAHAV